MIIKVIPKRAAKSSSMSIKTLTKYILNYSAGKNAAHKGATVLVRYNLAYGRDMSGYIKSFIENESLRKRRSDKNVVLHHSIISFSPHDHDKISNTLLQEVAQKWISLMAQNCPALAVAHTKANRHIHVISGINLDGRANRLSKQAFATALTEMEIFQTQHFEFLSRSSITHEKKSTISPFSLAESTKRMLRNTLKRALSDDRSSSKYEVYYRNNVMQGVLHEGKKYRFTTLGFSKSEIEQFREQMIAKRDIPLLKDKQKDIISEFALLRSRERGLGKHQALDRGRELGT